MFPKDSAFKQEEQRIAMGQAATPLEGAPTTAEVRQELEAVSRTAALVGIPSSTLEDWATTLDHVGTAHHIRTGSVQLDLEDLANEIRSYLP